MRTHKIITMKVKTLQFIKSLTGPLHTFYFIKNQGYYTARSLSTLERATLHLLPTVTTHHKSRNTKSIEKKNNKKKGEGPLDALMHSKWLLF